jgi:hypothetical protein
MLYPLSYGGGLHATSPKPPGRCDPTLSATLPSVDGAQSARSPARKMNTRGRGHQMAMVSFAGSGGAVIGAVVGHPLIRRSSSQDLRAHRSGTLPTVENPCSQTESLYAKLAFGVRLSSHQR